MKTLVKTLLAICIVLFFLNCLGTQFPIGSATVTTSNNIQISVKVKECVACFLDPDYRKKVFIKKEGKKRKFKLAITQDRPTQIILGKTKPTSIFQKEGIEELVIFPNNWGYSNLYVFESEKELNRADYQAFKGELFWNIPALKKELIIEIDTVLTIKSS